MTNRLDRLEKAGLVRRIPDERDRRSVQIEVTDEGRALYERAVDAQAAKEAIVAEALSVKQQDELNDPSAQADARVRAPRSGRLIEKARAILAARGCSSVG